MTTYVFDGAEVKLTGRKALRNQPGSRFRRQTEHAVDELYEIEPIDNTLGWKQWVRMSDLYKIEGG